MGEQSNTAENSTGTNDGSGSEAIGSSETPDSVPSSITKPHEGVVTADENKRFLAEIVSLRALQKASDTIAESITAEVSTGKILIVNEMDFAADEILYLDIRHKLDTLLKLSKDALDGCSKKITPSKEKRLQKGRWEETGRFSLVAFPALVSAAMAAIPQVSAFLGGVGDIVGLFRSDYEIRGQTLTVPEDIYIQALVADSLHRANLDAYLINFHSLKDSALIRDLNTLIIQKFAMLACAESIKSTKIDEQTEQATALDAFVAKLREKLADALLKMDKKVSDELRREIAGKTKSLEDFQRNRMPDSQIAGLESYLAGLRTKMVEELLKNNPRDSIKMLQAEVDKINEKLADKTLKEAEVQSLTDQRKLYQTKMVDLVANGDYNSKEILKEEIGRVDEELLHIKENRVPTTQITALEAHITSLNEKLVDSLATNDEEAKAGLEEAINNATEQIKAIRESIWDAQRIVNTCTKVSDAIDAFTTSITTVPNGRDYSPYVVACVREYFAGDEFKYILKVKLIASGADFIIEKPPFWSKDVRTSYLGGGVVSFILAEKDGKIIVSGTVSDVSALDHRIGEDPKRIIWNVYPEYKRADIKPPFAQDTNELL